MQGGVTEARSACGCRATLQERIGRGCWCQHGAGCSLTDWHCGRGSIHAVSNYAQSRASAPIPSLLRRGRRILARITSLLGLVVALVGCSTPSSPDTPSLTGVWNIAPPSPWSRFRLTLTQTGSLVGGSADIQAEPDFFNGTYQVLGTAAVDTFALNFSRINFGRLTLYGRLIRGRKPPRHFRLHASR